MEIKAYRVAIIPGAFILTAALSLVLVAPNQIRTLSGEWRKIKKIKAETKELKTKYLLISSLDKGLLESQAELAVAAVPEEKKVPYILQSLKNAANETGFLIKGLKFAPGELVKEGEKKLSEKHIRIEKLPVSLELVGPFDKLLDFFKAVETALPLFNVQDVELVGFRKRPGSFKLDVGLVTFYSPPATAYKADVVKLKDLILDEEENNFLEKLSTFRRTVVAERKIGSPVKTKRENPFQP